jgi:hypothetical protein
MGLLLTVATSQKYPQQKSPGYPNERIPPARYYSDRPITQDDYLPVKPVYGSNFHEEGNDYKYPSSHLAAGGSYNKYPPKDYNVPLSYCPEVGGLESHCRPAKDCAVWYDLVRKTPGTSCTLENGQGKGICCPDLPYNGQCLQFEFICILHSNSIIIIIIIGRHGVPFAKLSSCPKGLQLDHHLDRINVMSVNEAVELGKMQMVSMIETEKQLVRKNIRVRPGSQRHTHSWVFFHSTPEAVRISNSSLYGVYTALQLTKR